MNLLDFIEFNRYNLDLMLAGLVAYLAIIWAAVLLWVWRDTSSRTRGIIAVTGAVMLVFFGNILGLIVYLLIRPEHTLEEKESQQLFHTSVVDKDITACGHCATLVRVDYKFCPNCKHNLEQHCPDCKTRIHPEWNYCISCSARLYPESTKEKLSNVLAGTAWNIFNFPTLLVNVIAGAWNGYLNIVDRGVKGIEKAQAKVFGKQKTIVKSTPETKAAAVKPAKEIVNTTQVNYDLQAQINSLLTAEKAVQPKVEQAQVDESLDRVLTMFNFAGSNESSEA
jgi:hypothetical protein